MPEMFYGEFRHTIERVVVSKGVDQCLYVFPLRTFEQVTEQLLENPSPQAEFRDFRRYFLANSSDAEVDSHGRILIPASHREYAGLSRDVVVIGLSKRVEVWDAATYGAYSEKARENFAVVAEKIENLGL